MMTKGKTRLCRGFTLIELMVVISIIAVLASLSVPVIGRALLSSKRSKAQTEVASLATAIRAYFNEYSRFPHQSLGTAEYLDGNSDLINVLRAIDGEGNSQHGFNRKRIVFLEVSDASLSRNSDGEVEANPDMVDPWGQPYRVVVDINFSGSITPSEHEEMQGRTIGVWSLGDEPTDISKHIKSW
jgi:prepilin-type N-terminal cleavage/methylation domain-containing protein